MSSLRSLLEDADFTRLSLKKTLTLHYKVLAKINGCSCWLIVDTGASTSCINLNEAENLKMQFSESEIKATGAGASDLQTQISEGNALKLGAWKRTNMSFIVMDLSHVNAGLAQAGEDPIIGILGADVLKQARAVIDYGRNCMYFKM
ncbi:aspartyl protease family protein [Gilvibacter sp.]|uniref:aspartyl protease family protein n=1 Tax=Gilvibacter sp. TaxID=2729997 RepID=UPI0035BE1BA0